MRNIYEKLRIGSKLYEINHTCLRSFTKATARAYAEKNDASADRYFKAAQINALNGLRIGASTGASTLGLGEPVFDLSFAASTSTLLSLAVGGPVTVALPHLPDLPVIAAVGALTALVGTGTKPYFVGESSSRVVKGIGVFCQYGLVGLGEYAALKAADSQYVKQHPVGERACMVVACIFAGVLEPVRGALALFVFVSELPFAAAAAILSGAIGVILACRTKCNDPAAYTFGIDDLRPYVELLGAEQKNLNHLVNHTKFFFNALKNTSDRSRTLRILEIYSDPNFTASVEVLAETLEKRRLQPGNSEDIAHTTDCAARLIGWGPQYNYSMLSLLRKTMRFIDPDELVANLSEQSGTSEIAALAKAALYAATCARDICAEPLVSNDREPNPSTTTRGEPSIAQLGGLT